ncbi:CHAT domain-containing protein [Bradyrhizobium sp. U87765 SZCCT0131]|uniref:CHAT domain-containing protein n=1 Tax=unclassified Bradyrhizobium TaxID=2631580 RepID=UPI001BABCCB3|nr:MULTISPECIES: CHAT domain-containing protein [unclassified Bradyrhizobium]MBR1220384.1 CHAT domain-containing protein [Bradyrhizobium sp. U87765 SZCCT0131]MBR1263161.1 CHAT domain-containing protein [Bradyrhizobium sp. U87765 SZCCT0134]MBR1306956.1 CHAT domain-containing protein [Bradyrhizobium sp. U87765 SZCCT0110]MBR1323455.1 CHAT domain-containing protein [Bradyrhizobium sp. U87765 SZCCT0109]MBR1345910.1 CHAT domain-containing protein [Bradyrhizobium sp. U87765 SZCCT0048]
MASGGLHESFAAAFFRRSHHRWEWCVVPTISGGALTIESGPDDEIHDASLELDGILDSLPDVVRGWAGRSPEARHGDLDALKTCGRRLTRALFGERQHEFVREMKALGFPTISRITDGTLPQHLVEFCLLTDGDEEFFLGARWPCIYRIDNRSAPDLNALYPALQVTERRIGYAEDDSLASACTAHNSPQRPDIEEIYLAMELARDSGTLIVLDALSESVGERDVAIFRDWMHDRHHVKHFNAHVEITERMFRMRVRSKAFVGKGAMPPADRFDLTGSCVFLNACSSGRGSSSFRTSMAWYLKSQNAACVIYTTGPVDDTFATRFARSIYRHLDQGRRTLIEALTGARRELLQDGHPMALLYNFIGPDGYVLN